MARASGTSDVSLGLKWHTQDGDEATGRPVLAPAVGRLALAAGAALLGVTAATRVAFCDT